jgi:anti-sigma factor RsiW
MNMACDRYADAIDDLVSGTLPAGAREELEHHLETCTSCRDLAGDLERLRQMASALPIMEPPVQVWERISERLAAQTEAGEGLRARLVREWRHRRLEMASWLPAQPFPVPAVGWLAAVGVAVLAVATSVLLLRTVGQDQPAGGPQVPQAAAENARPSTGTAGTGNDLVQSVASELRSAEEHYEKAIAGLEQIAKSDEGALDPQIATVLQKNMAIVDQAIRDSRMALESQPGSDIAQESLFEAFRRKVGLLQDTIALINEMRKGNQAGAAKIIGGLNKS